MGITRELSSVHPKVNVAAISYAGQKEGGRDEITGPKSAPGLARRV